MSSVHVEIGIFRDETEVRDFFDEPEALTFASAILLKPDVEAVSISIFEYIDGLEEERLIHHSIHSNPQEVR